MKFYEIGEMTSRGEVVAYEFFAAKGSKTEIASNQEEFLELHKKYRKFNSFWNYRHLIMNDTGDGALYWFRHEIESE